MSTPVHTTSTDALPEQQRHAGAVGYGPNYHAAPTLDEKVVGLKEELKGKVMKKPELVQHGHDLRTGEEKRRKMEQDDDVFANAKDDASDAGGTAPTSSFQPTAAADAQFRDGPRPNAIHPTEKGAKEQAATVAPEGTYDAHVQKQGRATDQVKTI